MMIMNNQIISMIMNTCMSLKVKMRTHFKIRKTIYLFSEKCSIHELEEDDNVFSTFIKKFKKTDKVDAEVKQSLADMINSTFREGMPDDIYNDVIKNINRPENCHALKETQVNAGVWSVLKPQTQTEGSKMRGIQNAECKVGSNLAKLLDEGSNLDKEMKEWG